MKTKTEILFRLMAFYQNLFPDIIRLKKWKSLKTHFGDVDNMRGKLERL